MTHILSYHQKANIEKNQFIIQENQIDKYCKHIKQYKIEEIYIIYNYSSTLLTI